MFVMYVGPGLDWNGTIVRPQNPQRRDVQTLPAFSTLVIDIDMDNPGVWPLHCHIAWHVSQGLYVNILVSDFLSFSLGVGGKARTVDALPPGRGASRGNGTGLG
jgi:hypothetical protein